MGRNLDDIIKSLSAERQEKIKALSQKKVEEMIEEKQRLDFLVRPQHLDKSGQHKPKT